ncbi:acyl-CoA N-acyltransferase [Clohesyomyces aquaticus]|uniref:Acyl-CoA N-acyltransferase n=1 Tax=Clohesyomyces aquaticus TaxID=1231657 RepID=A0A1Y1Z922_9PLEO|nr:acyl-CoA N-acyltransferase [Clohesyomyces aquaticus]
MSIIVQEALDSDILRACEVEVAAYSNAADPNRLGPILFPGPFPPDAQEKRAAKLIEERKEDPSCIFTKAVDEETGELIAFSKWHIYETAALAAAAEKSVNIRPGMNVEACTMFFSGLAKRKKETMGNKPHIYLHLLHTDPDFQKRGAGRALLRWGTTKADTVGLPVYLESSPAGHPFYLKHEFADIDRFDLDLRPFGGPEEPYITPLMLREPKSSL